MDWLKEHVYLASWLSPLITLIALLVRAPKKGRTGEVDWLSIVLYVVLLTLVAGGLSPSLDKGAALFARTMMVFVLIVIVYREKT
jgi:hypothetical protein